MTNEQKYKTPEERVRAFNEWRRRKSSCATCEFDKFTRGCIGGRCQFYWLTIEAEDEKPEPCPFCGSECKVIGNVNHRVRCSKCNYESIMDSDKEKTIAAHNRIAKAVRAAEKGEVTK